MGSVMILAIPLLSATHIRLRVVAPMTSYSLGSLSAFQEEVNRGLADLVSAKFPGPLDMDFSFEQLAADFSWHPGAGLAGQLLARRTAVYT